MTILSFYENCYANENFSANTKDLQTHRINNPYTISRPETY